MMIKCPTLDRQSDKVRVCWNGLIAGGVCSQLVIGLSNENMYYVIRNVDRHYII